MTDKSQDNNAPISLPKGGGAIKGIGETFQPNLFSGTGNFSVPIFTSPGRNGFGPKLTLQYSTGNGNGPFGLGWQLSIPRITRKTEKGLPTYKDEDIFVMSGAEDLVPYLEKVSDNGGQWEPVVQKLGEEYTISLYRPRTEGQFARIERWKHKDGDVHWRATTKENVTSVYGRTPAARISGPHNSDQVFEWLLEETFDARGNHILYEYIRENPDLTLPGIHEHNRGYTQVYIRRILYGNTPDNLDTELRVGPTRTATDHTNHLQTRERHYVFEVLFDYGEFDTEDNAFPPGIPHELPLNVEEFIPEDWPVRDDPFSSFRAGFEIRTLRRCRRVLMLHHFKEGELEGAPLVKSTHFDYTVNPDTLLSLIASVTVLGYRKDPNNPQTYLKRDMPPVTFEYSKFEPQAQRYQSVTANGDDLPPQSLNAPDLTLMDVFGNGLTDILQTSDTGFYFWQNYGQGHIDQRRPQAGDQPAVSFARGNVSFGDMAGDGLADMVVDAPPMSGFYESTPDGGWRTFKRFEVMPSFELDDPNTRLVDLTGDGLSDVLVTRDDHFLWFRCKGEASYDEPRTVGRKHDLDAFPDVYFDDPAGRVRLSDMSGDGLNDIVLVHDGRIDYWPNLGYGKFGRRITMSNPVDHPPRIGYGFDPRRMFLVDLDGSGCSDLVYVDSGQVHFWFNRSGNAWSSSQTIHGTPSVTDFTALQFTDFYGTGTATLLWSYDHAEQPGHNYKILDFCGGLKPHLLTGMSNNMGATTRVQYAPSTKFYLEDKANGNPWITSLPFPVHVLEKTEVIDHISKTKLVTTYKYHHGYYDGREREFRGFGRVDQFDTEFFGDFSGAGLHEDDAAFDNNQLGFHVPPVETHTWFHTGVYFDPDRIIGHLDLTQQLAGEYYQGDLDAFTPKEHLIRQVDGTEGPGEFPHEAFRALRGAVLRTEVYGRDDSAKSNHPYVVTENRHLVKALQPKDGNNHGVFLTVPKESLSYHYERNPADPRISHNITFGIDEFGNITDGIDEFGNVTDSVAIGYPRRTLPEDMPEQKQFKVVYTRSDFINNYNPPSSTTPAYYYAGIPCQTRAYEITGVDLQLSGRLLEEKIFKDILDTSIKVDTDSFLPYEAQRDESVGDLQRRIIELARSYFRKDTDPDQIDPVSDLEHRLPLGEIDSMALPYEGYQAAFTDSMLQQIYGERITGIDLAGEGGYHPHPDHVAVEGGEGIQEYHWIPSGRQGFDSNKFFQADHSQDPFGNIASIDSDAYALLIEAVRDALPAPQTNVISAKNDYRVLQPFEVTDPNGNRSQVEFDALGLVVGTAVMGEDADGKPVGDSLEGFVADLPDDLRNAHLDDPLNLDNTSDTAGHNILKGATSRLLYDLKRFDETGQPNVVYTLARETHVSEEKGMPSKIQHAFVFSDGFGRESQTKVQAEPDPGDPAKKPRWVGTGTTIYNNKGKAVQQFEPFFSDNHRHGIERHGVSSTIFFDPLERVVCTFHPNHTYEKVIFDPWQQATWDRNDTVLLDPHTDPDVIEYVGEFFLRYDREYEDEHGEPPKSWHQEYSSSDDTAKKDAARKTERHGNTPAIVHLDILGRTFMTVAHNKFKRTAEDTADPPIDEFQRTRIVLDIEGNQREVIDAKDRAIMRYDYNMLSTPIHQDSKDAGERWILVNVAGNQFRGWDVRDQQFRTIYDVLRRPTHLLLKQGEGNETLMQRSVYGEVHSNSVTLNLKNRLYRLYDGAGLVTSEEFDFKGKLLRNSRQLATEYKKFVDWSPLAALTDVEQIELVASPFLETDIFTNRMVYDALNRPINMITPDSSQIQPIYNEANLLDSVEARLRGVDEQTIFVTNIDYNAKGQRVRIVYGCGGQNEDLKVLTEYDYDEHTFRLSRLHTFRPSDGADLQDLHYTYDPMGNITDIRDDGQQIIFFDNQVVSPNTQYTYDPVYRLIQASGREHAGQGADIQRDPTDLPAMPLPHPNDSQAMRNYTEHYEYDELGNILKMIHRAKNGNWTRHYAYDSDNNQLKASSLPGDDPDGPYSAKYQHDAHGNMIQVPHLPEIKWDYKDQMHEVNLGGGGITFYVYDASGLRVRKIHEHNGSKVEERIYVGGFEIYRKSNGAGLTLERETLHIIDDQQRIALVETKTVDISETPIASLPILRYQFGNHIDSAAFELDGDAAIISYEEYHPFGTSSYISGQSSAEISLKRYRYMGKERDDETGFYHCIARYYACWLGRWTSADPAGLVDGTNLYRYSRNNPVAFTDPSGNEPDKRNVGDVKTHQKQGKANYDSKGKRIDESEHIIPRRSKEAITHDPTTGKSDYDDARYRNDTTIVVERDTALNKTTKRRGGSNADNPRSKRLMNRAKADKPISYSKERSDAIENFERARTTTGSALSDADANRTILATDAEMFASQDITNSGRKAAEFDRRISRSPSPKKKVRTRGGGLLGKAIGAGVAVYFLATGDAEAAIQSVNPAANTTDTLLSGEASAGSTANSIIRDVYEWTPLSIPEGAYHMFLSPRGENIYDKKLEERAIQEERNPFCAQCHGPGGALDPKNEWNKSARFESLPTSNLQTKQPDNDALIDFIRSQPQ